MQVRGLTPEDAEVFLKELAVEGESAAVPRGGCVYLAFKRASDILISLIAIVLLSPFFLLAVMLVKLTSRGPIIFKQQRAGENGEPFTMYKFRTMRVGAEEDQKLLADLNCQTGPVFKAPDDPRLIPVGRFLRRSSLDELPQLFNVLFGQMSIVGPRPLWVPEAEKAVGAATLRTKVKPGLTCIWQVSGRSELSYDQWVLLDLYYIQHRSWLLDLLIILQTVPAVLSGHGAY